MPSSKKKPESTTSTTATTATTTTEVMSEPQTKKMKPVKTVANAVTPVANAVTPVEATSTTSIVQEKKETKKKVPKTETKVESVLAPEVENVVVVSDAADLSITSGFSEFISKFQSMLSQFNSLKTELRSLEKATVKQLKIAQKLTNKKRRKGTRAPSGFVRPSLISDELAKFLGKPSGTEMARTDVTREINKYIRANNLQDKENGRKINPDQQLTQLLKIEDTIDLTYFNLQKYMGPHFPKVVKTAEPVTATVM